MKAQQKVASVAAAALMVAGFITAAPPAQASPGNSIECPLGMGAGSGGEEPATWSVRSGIDRPAPAGPRVMLKAQPPRMAEPRTLDRE